MFRKQPKIDVKPNATDLKIIKYGWIFVFYFKLPEIIATHYDYNGNVDGRGHKSTLFILPIFNLLMYLGMTKVTTKIKPYYFNYPTKVTEKNAAEIYAITIRMMVVLNLIMVILFLVLTAGLINSALTNSKSLSVALILVFITEIPEGILSM